MNRGTEHTGGGELGKWNPAPVADNLLSTSMNELITQPSGVYDFIEKREGNCLNLSANLADQMIYFFCHLKEFYKDSFCEWYFLPVASFT